MAAPKSVDAYIKANPKWEKSIEKLREIIMSFDFDEQIKWQFPTYSMDKKNLLSIAATKTFVGVWFFQGGLLVDKEMVLKNAQEGKTKAMRQWRFESEKDIKKTLLKKYINETIRNHKAGKVIKPAKPNSKPLTIPNELAKKLKSTKNLKTAFENFSLSKQREFANYISDAKMEKTKLKRMDKILPLIIAGKGLNDRYK